MERPVRVLLLGAGGREFHNFNVYFRGNPGFRVLAFTAAQIPGIEGRRYPGELAGSLYPGGIPIIEESRLEEAVSRLGADLVVLSYSDLDYGEVGRLMSRALASGASFLVLGPRDTMIASSRPVIAVTAVRTGAGKSTVARGILRALLARGLRVAPIRHPMAYGDLKVRRAMKISSHEDLERLGLTVEEREEYEHYLRMGVSVYSGIDYSEVLALAEEECDVILWDGGNNDWPFIRPDFMVTVADAMRPGMEARSFPGEVNVRMADAIIINKVDQAPRESVEEVRRNVSRLNPRASISLARSSVSVERPELIRGRRVVVVEDSPTVTHGGAPYGAGYVAAVKYGAREIVDPRPYSTGIIREMYREYPHMGKIVPSTGYSPEHLRDLEETLERVPADTVVSGTPVDLGKLIRVGKPVVRVSFEVEVVEGPTLEELVARFLEASSRRPR